MHSFKAVKGIPLISELIRRADGRIIIMPGCGIKPENIGEIESKTEAKVVSLCMVYFLIYFYIRNSM
jgi:copper homeostasis protein CutC